MANFDPETIEQTVVEAQLDTSYTPLTDSEERTHINNGWYTGYVQSYEFNVVDTGEGSRVVLNIHWQVVDEDAKELMGRDDPTVRQSVFLDGYIDGDTGRLVLESGRNKNVQLGRVREALSQNTAKQWSFSRLTGEGPAMLWVRQKSDKNDPTVVYSNVARVAKPEDAERASSKRK